MTNDLFAQPCVASADARPIDLPGGEAVLFSHCFLPAEADRYFTALTAGTEIAWRQERIRVYGREYPVPRLTAWYGDPGATYTYSGIRHEPQPWTVVLLAIKERVEEYSGVAFNSVLLNLYRDGADSNGWHSDDEPELGPAPVIGSVSFGQPRKFQFRHRRDKALTRSLVLDHGSFLVMRGDTQRNWLHQVPKSKRRKQPLAARVNLTFRVVKTAAVS